LVTDIRLFSAGHSGAFTDRTILEQRHTEIPEEERHILSLFVYYLSVDNFWGLRPSVGKTVLTFTNVSAS
jgi:hypothetical protein